MDVYVLKLKTGEELLGELNTMNDEMVVLRNPMNMIQDIEGNYHGIVYAIKLAENDTVSFSNDDVMFGSFAKTDAKDYYISVFGDEDSNDDENVLSINNITQYSNYYH